MKKFLLSTILPAIALMALNSNAATSLTNFGALTISWTTLQQNEPLTEITNKTSKAGKTASNTVYTYKASTSSSNFGNAALLGLLSASFPGQIATGDKLATDGENIYVVDKSGSNVVVPNLSTVLTWSYSNSIISGAATITTNTAETNPVFTIITNMTVTSTNGTNVTLVTNIVEMTNIVTMTNLVPLTTNIDTITTSNSTFSITNYTYSTNIVATATNYSAITNLVISGTNYTTNIDENVSGTTTNYTTNFTAIPTYTNMVIPITTNVVMVTNTIYTTNFTYVTNVVDTKLTDSGTATYTTSSYFTLKYFDTNTVTEFTFHGLAATAIDVNLAKNTASETFSVKSGVGTGLINGKVTLITGTMTGSAKGASSPPAE
jgi:hypothetical protein